MPNSDESIALSRSHSDAAEALGCPESSGPLRPGAAAAPTPLIFAYLMDGLADPEGFPLDEVAVAVLGRLMRRPKLCRKLYVRLLRIAADAGVPSRAWDHLVDAAESNECLDLLLATRAGREPSMVLNPGNGWDVDYRQILHILEARLRRGEGELEHLRLVGRRLRAALNAEGNQDLEDDLSLGSGIP